MRDFEFHVPTRIIFGRDTECQIGNLLREYGYRRILLVYGGGSIKSSGLYETVTESLRASGIEWAEHSGVKANPLLSHTLAGIEIAKRESSELILGVGGGSVIDTAKEIAIGALDNGEHWDFAMGKRSVTRALPVGVILTIAAAGSEMSDSAVLTNEADGSKRGYNTPFHRPLFAICNPALTFTVDPYQTACGIVDILMHTLERYFSPLPETPVTDAIAMALCRETVRAGQIAYKNPTDYGSRAALMWASSVSHNGITGAGRAFVSTCHKLEHEISAKYDVAHGAGLAVVFPAWAEFVMPYAYGRFARFAREVFAVTPADDEAAAREGLRVLRSFFHSIGMPLTFSELGIADPDIEDMAYRASVGKSFQIKSYTALGYEEMLSIYRLAL